MGWGEMRGQGVKVRGRGMKVRGQGEGEGAWKDGGDGPLPVLGLQ